MYRYKGSSLLVMGMSLGSMGLKQMDIFAVYYENSKLDI